jgi:hypothetical protein
MYTCANDQEFFGRVIACCAQEHATDPVDAATTVLWPVCTATDIEAAYESAMLAGNPHPGSDEAVITDQMILSSVQAHLPAST